MKKVIFFLIAVLISAATQAQEANSFDISEHGMQMFRICATIFLLIALMMFVLAILKRILEFRIRNRIVDKGVPESLAASLLKEATRNIPLLNGSQCLRERALVLHWSITRCR